MGRYEKLSTEAVEDGLATLDGWTVEDGKLYREYRFKDFSEAFGFMTRAAMDCHLLDHHPEWSNVWNKVSIFLVTHSEGGITDIDFKLAGKFNRIFDRRD